MRCYVLGLVLLSSLASATPVRAEWFGEFFASFPRDFKRNNHWPEPFVYPDRDAVNAPISVMVANGWRLQTLMCEYHFDQDGKLNQAGESHLRWILTQVPVERRLVYVQRGFSEDVTAVRLDSVQRSAMRMQPMGDLPPVMASNLAPDGWPADEVDRINKDFFTKTPPAPRLPAPVSDGGSGGQ